jgi:subfamily B ATP-binding cassette protein HlyB/CyaB
MAANTENDPRRKLIGLVRLYAHLLGLAVDSEQLERLLKAEGGSATDQALTAVRTLEALGLEVRWQGRGSWRRLQRLSPPLLLQDKGGGLMLLGRVEKDGVLVQRAGAAEPERLERETLERIWSGVWIEARRPLAAAAIGGEPTGGKFGVGWFLAALKPHRAILIEVLLASLFIQVFTLATPLVFQVVIDKVLTHRTLTTLDVLALALGGIAVFEIVLAGLRHYLLSHTTNRVDLELGVRLFRHLMHLPLAYFEARRAGDTVARVRELENARNFLTGPALLAGLDFLFAFVFLAVMFYYSHTLTFIVLGALPLFFLISFAVAPLLRRRLEDKFALGAENQAFLVETVTAMETLKGQAIERRWQREWERRLADYGRAAFRGGQLAGLSNQIIGFLSKALIVVLLWFGARLVIEGELTVGGLIAFNMLAGRVNAPILRIAQLWQEFQQMRVSIRRLADIFDVPAEPLLRPSRSALPAIEGRVKVEHLSFRYRPDGPEVLSDISFEVAPGEIIGVVGVSGSGKTTLLRLLQRLYTPQKGRILIDGIDLALVDAEWLRSQIGVVSQETVLFNRTVRENIALADPELPMEKVIEAAKLAGAHEFILELPDGYDTLIGERGSKLSGGQRARLAIARALVHDPRLLLLDEATAALDYESERLIHENLAHLCAGRTAFIVAHRLPTLRLAHRIFVLERGRLIEQGSHQELMKQVGRYHALYRLHQALEAGHA